MFQPFTPFFRFINSLFTVRQLSAIPVKSRVLGLMLLCFCQFASAAPVERPDWSLSSDTLIEATICANETYLFDGQLLNAEGTYTAVYAASDGSDSTVTLNLSVLPLLAETVSASICQGESYPFNGLSLTQSGEYSVVLPGSNGCDSTVTLKLTVNPIVVTNLSAGICDGSFYIFQGDTLTESGTYLSVLSSSAGCDSLVRLKLDVVSYFDIQQSASICHGESYEFGGNLLDTDGVYVDTLVAAGGCDSVVTLTLHVLPMLNGELNVSICEGSEYHFHGDTLTADGDYLYATVGSNGCDSLTTLHLTTVPFFETSVEATICHGESYDFFGDALSDEGEYKHTLSAIGGCDSVITLVLSVLPTSTGIDGATICDGDTLFVNGEELTEPGDYTFTYTGANGCDSVVTFTLTVLETPNTVFEAVICHGDTYGFYGQILTESGVYEQIFQAVNGCDSIITLILTELPELVTNLDASVCEGTAYDFDGEELDQAGVYTHVYVSDNGCDSTVNLTLTILPLQHTTLDVSICDGESYSFDGNDLTESGAYEAVLTGSNGCDSTVSLNLTVLPLLEENVTATICAGSAYPFNGIVLTDAGDYTAVITGSNGCDSTIHLTLTVLPVFASEFSATICSGESYDYFGQFLTDPGDYEFNLTAENGCDSVVTIHLEVLPVAHTDIAAEICEGDAYDYNGELLTGTGSYDYVYPGANGCDSTVVVHLTVHPLSNTTLDVTLCEGSTYNFNGIELTVAGSYIATLTNSYGCDSSVVVNLDFTPGYSQTVDATICAGETYLFDQDELTGTGQYVHTYQAVGGCDSVVTLNLTVLPVSESETDATICAGETYQFNGVALTDAGDYVAMLSGENGCDSTATLHLSVLPVSSGEISATICGNETYAFGGVEYHQSGDYTAVYQSSNGCDSTVTLHLTVLPTADHLVLATICEGQAFEFNGESLSDAGEYVYTYQTTGGCDSVVTVQLTVLPVPHSSFDASTCNGDPYYYNSDTLTMSGDYIYVFPVGGSNGCDSVVTLHLTVHQLTLPNIVNATLCQGESYPYHGTNYTQGGIFTFHYTTAAGCDSMDVLILNFLPVSHTSLQAVICPGGSYEFNGTQLTAPGVYTATFNSANGCDSTVTLLLTLDTPISVTVVQQGQTLFASSVNGAYQWINCATNQPVAGATGNNFSPAASGSYGVVVTSANGCTYASNCVNFVISGTTESPDALNWVLEPNPAFTATLLHLSQPLASDMQLEILDPAGRLLHSETLPTGVSQATLDLGNFPDGLLFVRLYNSEGVSSKALLKRN